MVNGNCNLSGVKMYLMEKILSISYLFEKGRNSLKLWISVEYTH